MYVKSAFTDVPPVPETNVHNVMFHRPEQKSWTDFTVHIDGVTGRRRTYREFLNCVYDGATALGASISAGGLGLRADDDEIVGIMSENSLDYLSIVHSCFAIAVPFALLPCYSTAFELAHALRVTRATRLFVQEQLFEHVAAVARAVGFPQHRIYVLGGCVPGQKSLDDLMHEVRTRHIPREPVRAAKKDTLAYLIFSSGTTGLPKAVMISHGNILFSIHQAVIHMQEGNTMTPPQPTHTPEGIPVSLVFLPMYHTFGLHAYCLRSLLAPSTLVILPRWNMSVALAAISTHRVTTLHLVPSIISQLVHYPKLHEADLSSLQVVTSGASYLPPALAKQLGHIVPKQSVFITGYGMSECTIGAAVTPIGKLSGRGMDCPGSVGQLLPGMEARIIRDDGTEADVDEPGELLLKGGNIALGYCNDPKATRATFIDGWLHTGDRLFVNAAGHLFFADRTKDTLKINGMQVSPTEIENVLLAHPGGLVADAAVAGVRSGHLVEERVPRAWVVLTPEGRRRGAAAAQALDVWVQQQLSKHKWLRGGVEIVDAIPKSPTGKVLRRVLQEQYNAAHKPEARL